MIPRPQGRKRGGVSPSPNLGSKKLFLDGSSEQVTKVFAELLVVLRVNINRFGAEASAGGCHLQDGHPVDGSSLRILYYEHEVAAEFKAGHGAAVEEFHRIVVGEVLVDAAGARPEGQAGGIVVAVLVIPVEADFLEGGLPVDLLLIYGPSFPCVEVGGLREVETQDGHLAVVDRACKLAAVLFLDFENFHDVSPF